MSKKTLFILVMLAAVFVFVPARTSVYAQTHSHPSNDEKNESLGQRFSRVVRNFLKEDVDDTRDGTAPAKTNVQSSSTPTSPPKPLTNAEIKQFQSSNNTTTASSAKTKIVRTMREASPPNEGRQTVAVRNGTIPQSQATTDGDSESESDETIFNRLRAMRQRVFTAESIDASNDPLIQQAPTSTVSQTTAIGEYDPFLASKHPTKPLEQTTVPTPHQVQATVPHSHSTVAKKAEIPKIPQRIARADTPKQIDNIVDAGIRMPRSNQHSLNVEFDETGTSAAMTSSDSADVSTSGSETVTEKNSVTSPRLELTTEGPPKTIVGQEAVYTICITNSGNAPAEQVSLSAEMPNWLEVRRSEVSGGRVLLQPRSDNPQMSDLTWRVGQIETGKSETLVIRIVPQQRKTVDFRIKYDFHRPTSVTKIEVQEPVISLELQGPDEVLWGSDVTYILVVRNTGNGDAEDINLELLQTGGEMQTCPVPILKAGEELPIDVKVWTGKQEHIDINIQATGKYNLKSNVEKRITVRRPDISVKIDSPTIQFVGNPAEFSINASNIGNAAATDFEIKSVLPLGTQFISATNNGDFNAQLNQVTWKIHELAIGETFAAKIVCNPKSEGECKLEVTIMDQGGVLTTAASSFVAEAIVELKLNVEYPPGPVEVGKDALFTIHIKNMGTKAAENVEVLTAFDWGLEPVDVEGGDAFFSDSQVVFDKIPTIPAGQELVLKVKARADRAESIKVRTEIICKSSNIRLVDEHATYFYKKK